jgi:hypothetical protein
MTALPAAAGALSIEHTPLSDSDAVRLAAEEALHAEWARRTVRVVAASSRDSEDCRLLLSILGFDRDVIAAARSEVQPRPAGRKRRAHAA